MPSCVRIPSGGDESIRREITAPKAASAAIVVRRLAAETIGGTARLSERSDGLKSNSLARRLRTVGRIERSEYVRSF